MIINGFEIKDGILDLSLSGTKVIENKAFWAGRSIREVMFPSGIGHIGDWAFAKCSNLEKVTFPDGHRAGLFGRDVFKGCDKLVSVSFADTDETTAFFLALCANRLGYDSLIRSDDVGKKSWYAKWDICLATRIKSDDAEAKMSAALCGEEDISYDGIGSVDGEMPGENGDFVSKEAYNRSVLCYIRLSDDRYLSDETRALLEEHIYENRFGESGTAFYSIIEECAGNLSYLRKYLDIVQPDRGILSEMIASCGPGEVAVRSYLIKESSASSSALDDMIFLD